MEDRLFRLGDRERYPAQTMKLHKPDYTAEQSEALRRLSGVALALAALTCSCCLILATAFAVADVPNKPWGPLVGCLIIFSTLTFGTIWMSIRLIKKQRAENGFTTMPLVFIQICGMLFLAGLVFVAIQNQNLWIGIEGVAVAFAMLTIRSLIRKKQIEQSVQA